MDYQEYCKKYYSEEELASLIEMFVSFEETDVSDSIPYVQHFVMVQHYAAMMPFGFRYMGIVDGKVCVQWRNDNTDWEAGIKPYKAGCLISKNSYEVMEYPDPLMDDYTLTKFDNAAKAVLAILPLVGSDFVQNGLEDVPEPDDYLSSGNYMEVDLGEDADDSFEEHSRKSASRADKTVAKLKRKIGMSKFSEDDIKRCLKRVRKVLFELHDAYLSDFIQMVTVKDNSIRIRCYESDIPELLMDIYTQIDNKDDMFLIKIKNLIKNYKLELTSTNGKFKFRTDDIERICDIASECRYGTF